MQQPAWLSRAWADFGVREIVGVRHTPTIVGYFEACGHRQIVNDETPWCAAYVGAMLAGAGHTGTGSLLARSYLKWGVAIAEPQPGAIAVLTRGTDPTAGHVGFYLGRTAHDVILLGGNQSDRVSVAAFSADRLLGFRWPNSEAVGASPRSPPRPPLTHNLFEVALGHVLDMEGGYSDDPHDPGGPTNRGITLSVLANWRGETLDAASRGRLIETLKRIPHKTVEQIYRARYWQPARCEALPPALAIMHFDASVNHGVGGAIRLLQQALGVEVDGEIGPVTRGAIAGTRIEKIISDYADVRRARYRALPHFWRFGRGWLRRVDATKAIATAWLLRRPTQPTHQSEATTGEATMTNERIKETSVSQTLGNPTSAKWWLQSKTIWGALVTAAATLLPVIGPAIGLELPGEMVRQLGDQALVAIQAVSALLGTVLTIYGRVTATAALTRRDVMMRM